MILITEKMISYISFIVLYNEEANPMHKEMWHKFANRTFKSFSRNEQQHMNRLINVVNNRKRG